jgi:dTDP-D-glucose 4,6-dehydratase
LDVSKHTTNVTDRPGQDKLYAVDGFAMKMAFEYEPKRRISREIKHLLSVYPVKGSVHLTNWNR